jgi:hypothetical protein
MFLSVIQFCDIRDVWHCWNAAAAVPSESRMILAQLMLDSSRINGYLLDIH